MARRIIERSFDPTKPTVCRKYFVAGGRRFVPGNDFPWKQMSIAQRKAKLLFEAGHICHPQDAHKEPEPAKEQVSVAEPVQVQDAPAMGELEHYTDGTPSREWTEPAQEEDDGLDAINSLKKLRAIAKEEGAPFKVSKVDQRQAIRDNRKGG
jgi:hypothetical protein